MEAHMSEMVSLREAFSSYAQELTARLQTLRTRTAAIEKLSSFQGAAADAAKAYFTSVHGELIDELEETIKQLDENTKKIMNDFNQYVDRSESAVIKENYLQDLTEHVTGVDQDVQNIHVSEQSINQSVSDIVALSAYHIQTFSSSVHEAKRLLQNVMQDLHQFDQHAVNIVNNSDEQLASLTSKINQRAVGRMSALTGGFNLVSATASTEDKSISDMLNDGVSSLRHIVTGLNATDRNLSTMYQFAVLFQMDKRQRGDFIRTGQHAMTLAEYRRFNNMMRFSPYKMSTKEFRWQYQDNKMRGFPNGKMDAFKRLAVPFGKNRGKLAMIKEFDKLYGLEKYKEFKNLKTNTAKAGSIGKTFYNSLVGDKISSTKNIVKNTSWNKPKTFFKSVGEELKPKNTNAFGRVVNTVGRGLGPLSAGLHVRENFVQNKGDTQKVIVGSAVDIGAGSVATATGAAIGSAFLPPIGTVVGAGAGMLISAGFHKKFGEPPKSVSDHTKELANKAVDGVKNAAKNIGNKISGWFK